MIIGAAFAVVLLLLFASVSTPASRVAAAEKLELKMTVNKDIVPIGQQISFTLILKNVGNKNLTVTFGTSQAFDLSYYTTTG